MGETWRASDGQPRPERPGLLMHPPASSTRVAWGALALAAVFSALVIAPVLLNWRRACYHCWDLGIYAQEMRRISPADPNPYLTVSEIRAFNDHFDPIALLAAPLARLIEPSLAALVIELSFVVGAALLLFAIARRLGGSGELSLLLVGILLLGRATTSALTFPSHPTSWAVLPFVALAGALATSRAPLILAALAGLFLFKEEHVFVGYALSLLFFWQRRFRLGVGALVLSGVWSVVAFIVRPAVWGPTTGYVGSILSPWLETPLALLFSRLRTAATWRIWAEILLPLAPVFLWLRRQQVTLNPGMLVALAPLAATRFLSDRWSHHYGIAVVACSIGFLLPVGATGKLRPPARVVWLTLLLLLASQASFIGRYSLKTTLRGGLRHCPGDPVRITEIAAAIAEIERQPDATVFAMGNLVPLAPLERDIYHLERARTPPKPPFLALIEGPPTGSPWPIGHEGVAERVAQWQKTFAPTVLIKGRFVSLWRFESR